MMGENLKDRMALANGSDDCTCNVAANSPDEREHDEYCAFPMLKEAAVEIARMDAALAKIADPLMLDVAGTGMERALRMINTMRDIAKEARQAHTETAGQS